MTSRWFILSAAMVVRSVMAQHVVAQHVIAQPAPGSVDLASSALSGNARLPVNELPGPRLIDVFQPLVDRQVALGNAGKTINQALGDEDTGLAPYQNFPSLFRDLTCHSDAVVTGKFNASMSHPSASGAALYTDYDFGIDSVLKDNPQSSLRLMPHIVITRPGGTIAVNGGFIQFSNQMFLNPRSGRTYLLFLSQVPATGAYQPAGIASKGQVFSSLELQAPAAHWRIYRTAYVTRDFPELADATLQSIILASAGCQ
jgi:hypothetical protein